MDADLETLRAENERLRAEIRALRAERARPWTTNPINPRTMQPWRLADQELAPTLRQVQQRILSSKASARAYLNDLKSRMKNGR